MIKFPKKISDKKIKEFFKNKRLDFFLKQPKQKHMKINQLTSKTPYQPELKDLYRIYQFIVLNKRTTVLEFGCGWSTLIISEALNFLRKKYFKDLFNQKVTVN